MSDKEKGKCGGDNKKAKFTSGLTAASRNISDGDGTKKDKEHIFWYK